MFPRPFCLLVWLQLFCRVMCLTFRCDALATRNRCFWVCIANLAMGLGVPFVWAGNARVYAANYHFLYLGDGFLVLQCSAANIAPAKWYQARGARGHCFESVWFLSGKMCLEYKSGWSSDESLHSGVPQVSVTVIYFACLPPCFCCFCLL